MHNYQFYYIYRKMYKKLFEIHKYRITASFSSNWKKQNLKNKKWYNGIKTEGSVTI